jgi:hypothetical protein
MTSIAKEGGREASVPAFAATVGRHFGEVFEREPRAASLAEALDVGAAAVGPEAPPARVGAER